MNFIQIAGLVTEILPVVFQAMHTIQADTGKSWEVVLIDVLSHLTPGAPNAPALAPTATPVNPSDHPING